MKKNSGKKYWAFGVPVLAMCLWPFPASGVEGDPAATGNSAGRQEERLALLEGEDSSPDNVFQVILPADTSHVFDFIMDPEGLIEKTEAAAYGGLRFEEGANLFFRRADGEAEDYTSRSDALTIVNTGEESVSVTLTAIVTGLSSDSMDSVQGMAMTDDREFTDDTRPSLYLALTDGEQVVPVGVGEEALIETVMEDSCSFWLMGAVNSGGDWSGLDDISPVVTVTWKVSSLEGRRRKYSCQRKWGHPAMPDVFRKEIS